MKSIVKKIILSSERILLFIYSLVLGLFFLSIIVRIFNSELADSLFFLWSTLYLPNYLLLQVIDHFFLLGVGLNIILYLTLLAIPIVAYFVVEEGKHMKLHISALILAILYSSAFVYVLLKILSIASSV